MQQTNQVMLSERDTDAVKTEAVAGADQHDDVFLVATTKKEKAVCQREMLRVFESRKSAIKIEIDEINQSLELHRRRKWATAGWQRQLTLARKRLDYYDKLILAVEDGYSIIPDFPAHPMAVRVRRGHPVRKEVGWNGGRVESGKLPAGEGRYVGGSTEVEARQFKKQDGGTVTRHFASDYVDVEFPLKAVKPHVIELTQSAMDKMIFDEIAVMVPDSDGVRGNARGRGGRGDPLVIGRIVDPRSTQFHRRCCCFLIAWFIDTADL